MRKRRWLLAGLSLALLAACVAVWKWSERPPYAFMEGAEIRYVSPPRPDSTVRVSFYVRRDFQQVAEAAESELGEFSRIRSDPQYAYLLQDPKKGVTICAAAHGDKNLAANPWDFPPVPSGAQTYIQLYREATLLDRIHAWIYRLRWKGSTP